MNNAENKQLLLTEILTATQGTLLTPSHKESFIAVGTDTRKNLKDHLFIALKGDTHDAHGYLDQAVDAGATALLVHHWDPRFDSLKSKVTVILVSDTLKALQDLGQFRRRQWGKSIIAITGSNGKTTTKEFTAQILSAYKNVHYNKGSFNNHWGLPLTLLDLQADHEIAICEMGMNHSGEIRHLITIAEPNIVGVTMVGRAHLEGLGSIEAVAQAKEEIFDPHNPNLEIGIFNLDNPWTAEMKPRFKKPGTKPLSFSHHPDSSTVSFQIESMDFDALKLSGSIQGQKGRCTVPVFGKQNLTNLMFAACASLAAGLSPQQIWEALPRCQTTWGRNQRLTDPKSGAEILFDGYNANPDSQKALIENLKLLTLNRPLIGVFGEMRELGTQSPQLHEELGALASTVNFSKVFFVGQHGASFERGFKASKAPLQIFSAVTSDLMAALKESLQNKPLISIKGSRGVKLEGILKDLQLL